MAHRTHMAHAAHASCRPPKFKRQEVGGCVSRTCETSSLAELTSARVVSPAIRSLSEGRALHIALRCRPRRAASPGNRLSSGDSTPCPPANRLANDLAIRIQLDLSSVIGEPRSSLSASSPLGETLPAAQRARNRFSRRSVWRARCAAHSASHGATAALDTHKEVGAISRPSRTKKRTVYAHKLVHSALAGWR